MENLPSDVRLAYHNIADDPKYQHFVRIPDRIIQCIDYFGISCDRATTRARLLAYYLFIGVVDDEIDSGKIDTGKLILEYLSKPVPVLAEVANRSRVRLMTEILKSYLSDKPYSLMIARLGDLYGEVVSERSAAAIDTYIGYRESVGALTAEWSYLLIRPGLSEDSERLRAFMKQVGAIGCLIDSLIDLSSDFRLGLLGFKPGVMDYAKLINCILRNGLRVSLRYPGLAGLFLRAIGDNVQDRFRAERRSPQPSFVSARKAEPASVA